MGRFGISGSVRWQGRHHRLLWSGLCALALAACGGGSEDEDVAVAPQQEDRRATAAAFFPPGAIPTDAHLRGMWSPVYSWPLIALHAVLMPDGSVLSYGTTTTGKQTGYFHYDVWDGTSAPNAGHLTLPNQTGTDLFCNAQLVLPQAGSKVLMAGGDNFVNGFTTNTGNPNTNIFDRANNSLTLGPNMFRPRWYATLTTMPNGDTFIQGGRDGADRSEVRTTGGTFRLLSNVDTSTLDWYYPRNYVAPDGRVFGYDTFGRMFYINVAGTGTLSLLGTIPANYRGQDATSAMFLPGKILHFGGASNGAIVIDINSGTPSISTTQSLSSQRRWATATLLPNGRVLATGGSEVYNEEIGVNNSAEIWNPSTGQWSVGASGQVPRLYHSNALLMPDGSVLVPGGGAPGPRLNLNTEVYYPPYLFAAGGVRATRPAISSVPGTVDLGKTATVTVNSSKAISRVTLLKTGSVTHSFNMDQRFLELPFTTSGSTLTVQMPTKGTDAPPGYYMLFVIDSAGVPSEAKFVRMTVGGTGGGLSGSYYNNLTLAGNPVFTRNEAIDFNWGNTSPGAGVPTDRWSVRWSGSVKAPSSGSYKFQTLSDDGVRLWVNNALVIDDWNNHGPTTRTSASINLTAGQSYAIKLEYYDNLGGAQVALRWQAPGTSTAVPIPISALEPGAPPPSGSGTGLAASYFSNATLTGTPVMGRTEAVNFAWGTASPGSGVPVDRFSVRWEGTVNAPSGGSYQFQTLSDDGVRLWVNGVQLINNWTNHGPTTNTSAAISLTAGQRYAIRLEYYENVGGATIQMNWKPPGASAYAAVPANQLFPN
ncbi:PA14 domain-containing protein [Rivibacter subsaxonicus]|uniref:Uncharacterized protein DUF1929 n=1 Tax=Rivibacter subsaxonicus TaxID=457575 RepID=A0A4Q7VW58_9BURK|nr:PA14 domain-containing protein [Rivibacter subsaxonicus]RZU00952.1 uncharacterized protein DUF1929 [Rivibacter subsaxonicus]